MRGDVRLVFAPAGYGITKDFHGEPELSETVIRTQAIQSKIHASIITPAEAFCNLPADAKMLPPSCTI